MTDVPQHDFSRTLVCVEYPGVVTNEDKMLETLGGLRNLSEAYSTEHRKLELCFRPDDIQSKPVYGSRYKTTGFLIKVKVTKHHTETGENTRCVTSVLGVVKTVYRFSDPCDFQYLPLYKELGLDIFSHKAILSKGLPTSEWLKGESPLFLLPSTFARIDTVQDYCYQKLKENDDLVPHLIGSSRPHRLDHAVFIYYDSKSVPTGPAENAPEFSSNSLLSKHLTIVKQLFEDRPVWSKSGVLYNTKFSSDQLKCLLPLVAYYFVSGPWRTMWVRYNYDPRREPSSRVYQTLDFRLRRLGGLRKNVKAKRSVSNKVVPFKIMLSRPIQRTLNSEDVSDNSVQTNKIVNENIFLYRPGMVPPARQMFYQYCDVLIPEIQTMLEKLPAPDPSTVCHEKYGWMPPGLDEQCREILTKYVLQTLKKKVSQCEGDGSVTKSQISQQVLEPELNSEEQPSSSYNADDSEPVISFQNLQSAVSSEELLSNLYDAESQSVTSAANKQDIQSVIKSVTSQVVSSCSSYDKDVPHDVSKQNLLESLSMEVLEGSSDDTDSSDIEDEL